MAYVHHTRCVTPSGFRTMNHYIAASLESGAFGALTALVVLAAGMPWCLLIAAELTAFMWVASYCQWWLFGRLICLGGGPAEDPLNEHKVVGMVVSNETPDKKSGLDAFDTDFSINLLLVGTQPGVDRATAEASTPYGKLVTEQKATKDLGRGYAGYDSEDKGTGVKSHVLHAEFEGGGIDVLSTATGIAIGITATALIACLAGGPWGAALAVILAILALIAMAIGAALGLGDEGSPLDTGLPSIETNDDTNSGADILGIAGTWVFDSAHSGYNEIHPIKHAQKLGKWDGDWPANIDTIVAEFEEKTGEAGSPLVVEAQQEPQHDWKIHPLVDGCRPQEEDGDDEPDDVPL